MPTTQLEALLRCGTAAQRAPIVKKVVSSAASLAQHRETQHVVEALIETCDNTVRCELLFAIRGKVQDLARCRTGNVVLQALLKRLPAMQKKEFAELILPELTVAARHLFGNRVVQTALEFAPSAEVLEDQITKEFPSLCVHPVGQFVAIKAVAAFPQLSEQVLPLLVELLATQDSHVLSAVLESIRADDDVKNQIHAALLESLPTFVNEARQGQTLAAAIAAADEEMLDRYVAAIKPMASTAAETKGAATALAAIAKRRPEAWIADAACGKDIAEALQHSYRTVVIRALAMSGQWTPSKTQQAAMATQAPELAKIPAAAATLQQLLLCGSASTRTALSKALSPVATELATDGAGAHVVQALLETAGSEALAAQLVANLDLMKDQAGTHVWQKALPLVSDEAAGEAARAVLADDVLGVALDSHSCFSLAPLMRRCKAQQLPEAKMFLDSLKPHVQRLATSRNAGKVVLDAVFACGSQQLRDAIRNVIFLKCEIFFSAPSGSDSARPTAGQKRPKRD